MASHGALASHLPCSDKYKYSCSAHADHCPHHPRTHQNHHHHHASCCCGRDTLAHHPARVARPYDALSCRTPSVLSYCAPTFASSVPSQLLAPARHRLLLLSHHSHSVLLVVRQDVALVFALHHELARRLARGVLRPPLYKRHQPLARANPVRQTLQPEQHDRLQSSSYAQLLC
jgi:hypothetical protein